MSTTHASPVRSGAVIPIRRAAGATHRLRTAAARAADGATQADNRTGDVPTRLASVEARLSGRLAADGALHAAFAAAVLVARGRRLLDQAGFAALVGVPVAHVRSWETGRRPPRHAPRRLADLEPAIDWAVAGVLPRGHLADPASRHPAAGRR